MVKRPREDLDSSPSEADSPVSNDLLSSTNTSARASVEPAHTAKYTQLDQTSSPGSVKAVMQCHLPPHKEPLSFASFDEYDVHYYKDHLNRCLECGKNFPSEHFLGLHIAENHDPINDARRAKGEKTYACFVEDCDRLCSAPHRRRMHLIDKHMFPTNYDFFIVNDGLDKRNSMLRPDFGHRRRSSAASRSANDSVRARRHSSATTAGKTPTDTRLTATGSPQQNDLPEDADNTERQKEEPSANRSTVASTPKASSTDDPMESITKSMSALKFVPPSIRFGRGRGKGGLARR